MGTLFVVYLQNSLELSVIALLLLGFSPLLERRYSAKCRYYLWAVIFVSLLLPVRAKITLTLPEVFQPILPQSAAASGTAAITDTVMAWDWHPYAGLLWVTGVLCFLGWNLFQHLRFLSAVRRWNEDIKDSDILKQFILTKAELEIRDRITIKSCACIKTPMVIGLFHSVVLLPKVNFPRDELPLILKHELVHYKRKDLWYKVLLLTASAIHWFNPVVHLMVRFALNLCEISCDEEVLQGRGAKGRAQYGEAIIGVIRSGSTYHTALSTNFYTGTQGMKKRIYAMMDMSRKRFSPALLIVIFVITICGTTAFALSPVHTEGASQNASNITTVTTGQSPTSPEASSVQRSTSSDAEQNHQEKQSAGDNALLPNESEPVLMPVQEDTPTESSQELTYNHDTSLLIAGSVQP